MAQRPIREYDAKHMRYTHIQQDYAGILIEHTDDLQTISDTLVATPVQHRVVKPDQLFGKRGKHGLLGVKLSPKEIVQWIQDHRQKDQDIDGVVGTLDTFLIEPFVAHTDERYIAIKTTRDADIILFSREGGIDVEENWEKIQELSIPVLGNLQAQDITQAFGELPEAITSFITQLFSFFRTYGFSYLEVNPFTLNDQGGTVCLDMVARVDTCEAWKQRTPRKNISWVKPFGSTTHPLEEQIEAMDAETGASLKFSTLNATGSIGLLLGGGGASVITMDKLGDMGLLEHTINYGELSGNPNYWHNKAYTQGLIDLMCENQHTQQRLCLIGGIANFTRIDVLAKAFVDALTERVDDIKKHNIHLLVRRGGVNDIQGLAHIERFCKQHDIPCTVADGDVYITQAMETLQT